MTSKRVARSALLALYQYNCRPTQGTEYYCVWMGHLAISWRTKHEQGKAFEHGAQHMKLQGFWGMTSCRVVKIVTDLELRQSRFGNLIIFAVHYHQRQFSLTSYNMACYPIDRFLQRCFGRPVSLLLSRGLGTAAWNVSLSQLCDN